MADITEFPIQTEVLDVDAVLDAASTAVDAVDEIKDLTASATSVPNGDPADATYDPLTGNLAFEIPDGDQGDPGDSAYTVAVDEGFVGTEAQWLASLKGDDGDSAYTVAVDEGFVGTEAEWLASLVGPASIAASVSEIQSLTGSNTVTPEKLKDSLDPIYPSGSLNFTPDWESFITAEWVLTINRTMANPTNVIPGTRRVVTVKSADTTNRIIFFGLNYRGDMPTVSVSDTEFTTLFLYAVSATQILVTAKDWT